MRKYALILTLLFYSCDEDEPLIEDTLYLRGTLDGENLDLSGRNHFGSRSSIKSADAIAFKAFNAKYFFSPNPVNQEINVYMGSFFSKSLLEGYRDDYQTSIITNPFKDAKTFYDLFSTGSKNYLDHTNEYMPYAPYSGVYVEVRKCDPNANCKSWLSYKKKSLKTPNNNFTIDRYEILGKSSPTMSYKHELEISRGIIIEGNFNCWLYNEIETDSIKLDNVKFKLVFLE